MWDPATELYLASNIDKYEFLAPPSPIKLYKYSNMLVLTPVPDGITMAQLYDFAAPVLPQNIIITEQYVYLEILYKQDMIRLLNYVKDINGVRIKVYINYLANIRKLVTEYIQS